MEGLLLAFLGIGVALLIAVGRAAKIEAQYKEQASRQGITYDQLLDKKHKQYVSRKKYKERKKAEKYANDSSVPGVYIDGKSYKSYNNNRD